MVFIQGCHLNLGLLIWSETVVKFGGFPWGRFHCRQGGHTGCHTCSHNFQHGGIHGSWTLYYLVMWYTNHISGPGSLYLPEVHNLLIHN